MPWVDVRDRRRTVRSALVGGRLATIAGAVVLLATVLLVGLDSSDGVALAAVLGLTLLGLVACAGWVLWYRYQESSGAIQRRQMRLLASRLGPAGRSANSRQSHVRNDRPDTRPDGRPVRPQERQRRRESDWEERQPRRDSQRETGTARRESDPNQDPVRPPRRPASSPNRRDGPTEHHRTAPQHDRSEAPRPPSRDPQRRPTQLLAPSGRTDRGVPSPTQPRRSDSRPTGNAPRP